MPGVGILGGSFNPIHNGHIKLAEGALSAFELEKIIFIPTGSHAFKSDAHIPEARARYEMTAAAVSDHPKFEVSPIEIKRKGISYMVDTLRELKSTFLGAELALIIGGDIIFEIERWKDFGEYGKLCTICVAMRPGYCRNDVEGHIQYLSDKYDATFKLAEIDALDISSTDIRRLAACGGDISSMVPSGAEQYIRVNKIYGK